MCHSHLCPGAAAQGTDVLLAGVVSCASIHRLMSRAWGQSSSGVLAGLQEQGCQSEGLPCASILPGPLILAGEGSWQDNQEKPVGLF